MARSPTFSSFDISSIRDEDDEIESINEDDIHPDSYYVHSDVNTVGYEMDPNPVSAQSTEHDSIPTYDRSDPFSPISNKKIQHRRTNSSRRRLIPPLPLQTIMTREKEQSEKYEIKNQTTRVSTAMSCASTESSLSYSAERETFIVTMDPTEIGTSGHPHILRRQALEKAMGVRETQLQRVKMTALALRNSKKQVENEMKKSNDLYSRVSKMKKNVQQVKQTVEDLKAEKEQEVKNNVETAKALRRELQGTRSAVSSQEKQLENVQQEIQKALEKIKNLHHLHEKVLQAASKRDRFQTEARATQEVYEEQVRNSEVKMNTMREQTVQAEMVRFFLFVEFYK